MRTLLCIIVILSYINLTESAVTLPIRAVYRTWEDLDYSNITKIVERPILAGYNFITLSFLGADGTPEEAAGSWAAGDDGVKSYTMQYAHSVGVKVLLAVRLAKQYGDPFSLNATDVGIRMAKWAQAQHLDGIDWYPFADDVKVGFQLDGLSDVQSVQWLVDATLASRSVLGPDAIIVHSPQPVMFGPKNMTGNFVGPTGGYTAVNNALPANAIDYFFIYYFNQPGCYMDYQSMFTQSESIGACPAAAAVQELGIYSSVPMEKVVIVKPVQEYQSTSGFSEAPLIHQFIYEAYQRLGWNVGVCGWSWNDTDPGLMANWIDDVFQPDLPEPPAQVFVTNVTQNSISLAWPHTLVDGYATVSYVVRRGTRVVYSGPALNYTDVSLARGTLYNYTLSSSNVAGTSLTNVTASAQTFDTPSPPTPPTLVTYNTTSIAISWSAPLFNGLQNITSYLLTRDNTTIYKGSATQYIDGGLLPGSTHTYVVFAMNAVGASQPSKPFIFSTNIASPDTPTAPSQVSSTQSSITMSWTPPFNGGSNITYYLVLRTTASGSSSGGPFQLGLDLTFKDANLESNTQYVYSVAAVNKMGPSPYSVGAHLSTTVACPDNAQQSSDGSCYCAPGYYQSGSGCSAIGVLAVAIIIPVVVVIAIILVVFVIWRRQRRIVKNKLLESSLKKEKSTMNIDLGEAYMSSNLITDYEEIKITRKLGTGGSGIVFVGVWRNTEVAVKEYRDQNIQTTDFIRESEIHAKLRHPNVVQLLAICLPPHLCAVSEFMTRGSLTDVLEQKPPEVTWKVKCQMVLDIARGMDYLHKSRIIHRDLKSQNCLVDKNWGCKIADFGTSKFLVEDATATVYVPRTAQWTAPEVITQNSYSEKSDVFSYGIILWEVLTGKLPYDGVFAYQVEDRTVHGQRLTVPEGCDSWYEVLMRECWHADPNERPTFEQIIVCLQEVINKPEPKNPGENGVE